MTTSLLHARITPLRSYKHQWNENFDAFISRAEQIIALANVATMTMNQILIMIQVDMMTNKHLLEEVHKDFEKIFAMSYKGALFEFRQIHNRLMT